MTDHNKILLEVLEARDALNEAMAAATRAGLEVRVDAESSVQVQSVLGNAPPVYRTAPKVRVEIFQQLMV